MAKVKDINFLPERLIRAREKRRRNLLIITVTIMIMTIALGPYGYLQWRLFHKEQELTGLQDQYLKVKVLADEVNSIKNKRVTLQEETTQLKEIIDNRHTWPEMFRDIETIVPTDLWFVSVELKYAEPGKPNEGDTPGAAKNSGGTTLEQSVNNLQVQMQDKDDQTNVTTITLPPNQTIIKGKSISLEHIGRLVYKLNELPYFSTVEVQEITRIEETETLEFTIVAPLKEGASHD